MFFDINKLQMLIEFKNSCAKKTMQNGLAPLQHHMLKALLAQLDRASVF
tara:strand:- start:114 stop:260 length:147 start_codon:yes stop_codon:yes gene_type:complete